GADRDRDGHALLELADLTFVDGTLEDHVVHVGDGGDGGAFVEVVGLDDRGALFYGDLEHHSLDGGLDQVRDFARTADSPLFHELQVVAGGLQLLFGEVVLEIDAG